MKDPLLFGIICIIALTCVNNLVQHMTSDKNAIIRGIGYLIAAIVIIGVFLFILYYYFDITITGIKIV